MNNIEQIKNDEVYKQIMSDSYGGIMYNVDNKYKGNHLVKLWNTATASERENAGGIVSGAIDHLTTKY